MTKVYLMNNSPATYEFRDSHNEKTVITYIYTQKDGNPSGAANYFYQTFSNPSNGNNATQFIRANQNASLTRDHQFCDDTKYRYYICGKGITANLEVSWFPHSKLRNWDNEEFIYKGTILDFIEQNKENIQDYHPFFLMQVQGGSCYLNAKAIKVIESAQGGGV